MGSPLLREIHEKISHKFYVTWTLQHVDITFYGKGGLMFMGVFGHLHTGVAFCLANVNTCPVLVRNQYMLK